MILRTRVGTDSQALADADRAGPRAIPPKGWANLFGYALATLRKVRYGQPLTLTEWAETFQNIELANVMLTREYRAPFIVPNPECV